MLPGQNGGDPQPACPVAGEYDNQLFHLSILRCRSAACKYKVSLHPGLTGGDLIIKFNMTYNKDSEIAKWFHNRDFFQRPWLSPSTATSSTRFWSDQRAQVRGRLSRAIRASSHGQYRTMWATHDPQQANAMLM